MVSIENRFGFCWLTIGFFNPVDSLLAIAAHAYGGGLNTEATMMHNEISQGAWLA